MIEYVPRGLPLSDLHLYQYGIEKCCPGHFHGPAVRDHFLIHYILDGKGIFEVGSQTFHLEKGQGFLICPDVVTYYRADEHNPWHYCWFGFHGLQAEAYLKQAGLTAESPIFRCHDDELYRCFKQMVAAKGMVKARELNLVGSLYSLLSLLVEGSPTIKTDANKKSGKRSMYVKKVVDFIEMNYAHPFTIAQIAQVVGLNRSYLCSIFKDDKNLSIQAFLVQYRINKACELLKNDSLSIADISRSVGYDDPLLFSKIFKKIKGAAPRDYRSMYII